MYLEFKSDDSNSAKGFTGYVEGMDEKGVVQQRKSPITAILTTLSS